MTLLAFKWFAILQEHFLWLFYISKKLTDLIHHSYSSTTVLISIEGFRAKK